MDLLIICCLCLIEYIYLPYRCSERLKVVCVHLAAATDVQILILVIAAIFSAFH